MATIKRAEQSNGLGNGTPECQELSDRSIPLSRERNALGRGLRRLFDSRPSHFRFARNMGECRKSYILQTGDKRKKGKKKKALFNYYTYTHPHAHLHIHTTTNVYMTNLYAYDKKLYLTKDRPLLGELGI